MTHKKQPRTTPNGWRDILDFLKKFLERSLKYPTILLNFYDVNCDFPTHPGHFSGPKLYEPVAQANADALALKPVQKVRR
jgi:hypothetical protein